MEATSEDVKSINPAHLSPADAEAKAGTVGLGKADMPLMRAIPLALLAGMFIASGALFMLIVKGDSTLPFAASQVLGGACFALGLISFIFECSAARAMHASSVSRSRYGIDMRLMVAHRPRGTATRFSGAKLRLFLSAKTIIVDGGTGRPFACSHAMWCTMRQLSLQSGLLGRSATLRHR